ncbi:UvrD-helicase domain-containing protein [Planctomicrobium sp. SH664]|uniref:UvrD-helicase domain-containing protein n=1 Tax=Planctomicrobium sp. SH664 TaxID=3448125 RepID=UPI003F5CB967
MTMNLHSERTTAGVPPQRNSSVRTLFNHPVLDGPGRRLLIRASAGTGKTFQLSNRYISLLRASSAEKILASTFTRKAAGEILERILKRLAEAACSDEHLAELQQHLGGAPLERDECLQLLAELTRNLHRVRISTLDSFFAQLAGSYALELGFPPGWQILDDTEVVRLHAQAVEILLRDGDPQDVVQLMHLLDKGESSRSVSGLIRETIARMYDVFLTAPASCWEQFPELPFLSRERREGVIKVLEAAGQKQQGRLATAVTADCALIREEAWDEFRSKGLMKKIAAAEYTYHRVAIPDELIAQYQILGDHVRAEIVTPWRHQNIATRQLLTQFHRILERLKDAHQGLSFSDVPRRLALARATQAEFNPGYRLDADIEHILLDEFQDTSPQQWSVIRPFAENACGNASSSFFCVGDVKQAVYGWRGGEAAIFDTIEQQLGELTTQPLNKSYRSSQPVIDFVNHVMTGLNRHDNLGDLAEVVHRWTTSFPQHETSRSELAGFVRVATGPEAQSEDDRGPRKSDNKGELWTYTARYVAQLIKEAPHATVGILTRTNVAVGRMIFELNQLGIEASEEAGNPLTDSAAVQMVLSLMTFADHPGHTIARHHVARSPLGSIIGYEDDTDPELAHAFALSLRQQIAVEGFGGVIYRLIEPLSVHCNRRELRRLIQLAELAEAYDATSPGLRTRDFVDFAEKQKRDEPSAAQVRVMNMHQAKGLEFDIVVLPELDALLTQPPKYVSRSPVPGEPPSLIAIYRDEQQFEFLGGELAVARQETYGRLLQEALCLLYVALTRAVHALHILIIPGTSAKHAKTFAGLIRAAVCADQPLTPETTLYEYGDPLWHQKFETEAIERSEETAPVIAEISLNFAPSTLRRRLPRTTPSRSKQAAPRIGDILSTQSTDSLPRGILFHRWLEKIEFLEQSAPADDELRRLAAPMHLPADVIDRYLLAFRTEIQAPAIAALFTHEGCFAAAPASLRAQLAAPGIQLSIKREWPFVTVHQGELVNGTVDRLVLAMHEGAVIAAEVIDFKTDQLEGSEAIDRRAELYRPQLESYRQAVSRMFKIPQTHVSARLAFLAAGRVVTITPSRQRK